MKKQHTKKELKEMAIDFLKGLHDVHTDLLILAIGLEEYLKSLAKTLEKINKIWEKYGVK